MFDRLKYRTHRLFHRRDRSADARERRLEAFYTNSEAELESLRALVTGPVPASRIVMIHGTSGVGKSSLLWMFRLFCRRQPHVSVALGEGRSAIELLRRFAEDLEDTGVLVPRFRAKLRELGRIQAHVKEKVDDLLKATVKLGGQVASAAATLTPYTALAAPFLGSEAAANLVSSILTKTDHDLYLRPLEALTKAFTDDMYAVRGRRVALLIDTYEQAKAINDWVANFVFGLPESVVVVIAGRETPASMLSPSWEQIRPSGMTEVLVEKLKPLEDSDLRLLVQKYFRGKSRGEDPDPAQVEKLLRFSGGLPLIVTTAVDLWAARGGPFDFDEEKDDVVQHLVNDHIMKDSPEGLRTLLEAGATLRTFNKEALAALTDASIAEAGYREVERAAFVQSGSKGLALHDKIRDVINAYVETNTPERAAALHERAATYYEKRLERASEPRQRLGREEIAYHRYRASPANGRRVLRDLLDAAYARRQLQFCRELMNDARTYVGHDDDQTLDWLAYYDALLEVYAGGEPSNPPEMLETLLRRPHLERDLRASALEHLAEMIWYYKLRAGSDVKRADRLYDEALTLRRIAPPDLPGQARLLIGRGVLRQRTSGKGEPLFREALEIAQTLGLPAMTAWAQRELSIALRMQGHFQEAFPLIDASAQTFEALGLDTDAAHSVLNQGMFMAAIGRFGEAEKFFRKCQELFDNSAYVRPGERGWLLHGLADLELHRGHPGKAREILKEAAEQWKDDKFGSAVVEGAQAAVELEDKNFNLALQHAERALDIGLDIDDAYGHAWSLKTKGLALRGLGRMEDARPVLDEALRLMKEYGATHAYCLLLAESGDDRAAAFAKENGYDDILAMLATNDADAVKAG